MSITEKKRISNARYTMKCDYINLRPLKPVGEKIRESAKAAGKSLQGYVLDAVDRQMAYEETGENEIDGKILVNLMQWLKEHGHSDEEVLDCLKRLSN